MANFSFVHGHESSQCIVVVHRLGIEPSRPQGSGLRPPFGPTERAMRSPKTSKAAEVSLGGFHAKSFVKYRRYIGFSWPMASANRLDDNAHTDPSSLSR